MKTYSLQLLLCLALVVPLGNAVQAADTSGSAKTAATAAKPAVTVADYTRGMTHQRGYFDFYHDASSDKLYLLIDKLEQPFIFQSANS